MKLVPIILLAMAGTFAATIVWILDEIFTVTPFLFGGDTLDSGGVSKWKIHSACPDTSSSASSIMDPGEVCLYASWQRYIPPFITSDDSASVRRRYDTLPCITTTDPLPFTNIVLRSSFKAGSSFMSGIVRALYEGNETQQRWLNESRKRHPRRQHPGPWRTVAFLRDPIERFESMYSQMLQFSNRKYHWYGDGDADWLEMSEGHNRVQTFVTSVKRRFYNEHLLPQLWFLADSPTQTPNLTFVGRLEQLLDDWDVMVSSLGVPDDVARNRSKQPEHSRNVNKNNHAKISLQHAMHEGPDANTTLLDVCNIYHPDFGCFTAWLSPPNFCEETWRKDEPSR